MFVDYRPSDRRQQHHLYYGARKAVHPVHKSGEVSTLSPRRSRDACDAGRTPSPVWWPWRVGALCKYGGQPRDRHVQHRTTSKGLQPGWATRPYSVHLSVYMPCPQWLPGWSAFLELSTAAIQSTTSEDLWTPYSLESVLLPLRNFTDLLDSVTVLFFN